MAEPLYPEELSTGAVGPFTSLFSSSTAGVEVATPAAPPLSVVEDEAFMDKVDKMGFLGLRGRKSLWVGKC